MRRHGGQPDGGKGCRPGASGATPPLHRVTGQLEDGLPQQGRFPLPMNRWMSLCGVTSNAEPHGRDSPFCYASCRGVLCNAEAVSARFPANRCPRGNLTELLDSPLEPSWLQRQMMRMVMAITKKFRQPFCKNISSPSKHNHDTHFCNSR